MSRLQCSQLHRPCSNSDQHASTSTSTFWLDALLVEGQICLQPVNQCLQLVDRITEAFCTLRRVILMAVQVCQKFEASEFELLRFDCMHFFFFEVIFSVILNRFLQCLLQAGQADHFFVFRNFEMLPGCLYILPFCLYTLFLPQFVVYSSSVVSVTRHLLTQILCATKCLQQLRICYFQWSQ